MNIDEGDLFMAGIVAFAFGDEIKDFLGLSPPRRATCPACGDDGIEIPKGAVVGEMLDCPACGAELDLVGLDPPELMLSREEGS